MLPCQNETICWPLDIKYEWYNTFHCKKYHCYLKILENCSIKLWLLKQKDHILQLLRVYYFVLKILFCVAIKNWREQSNVTYRIRSTNTIVNALFDCLRLDENEFYNIKIHTVCCKSYYILAHDVLFSLQYFYLIIKRKHLTVLSGIM